MIDRYLKIKIRFLGNIRVAANAEHIRNSGFKQNTAKLKVLDF